MTDEQEAVAAMINRIVDGAGLQALRGEGRLSDLPPPAIVLCALGFVVTLIHKRIGCDTEEFIALLRREEKEWLS